MTRVPILNEYAKYDADHDILHVWFGSSDYAVDDEDFPGIIVRRSVQDDRVTGLTIMDFTKRKPMLRDLLPRYDFSQLSIH